MRLPIALAALLALAKCAFLVSFPLRNLCMTPWLLDDAFITMRIARNLATGRGYSFDGLHPTSGSPLLWTVLTSLNHLWLSRDVAALVTLIESVLLGAVATVLTFTLAATTTGDRRIAWAAFALCSLSTSLFVAGWNGMETTAFTCLGLFAVLLYHRLCSAERGAAAYGVLGVVLGLLMLARADGVFVALAIVLLELDRWRRSPATLRKPRGWRIALLAALCAAAASPVALWSIYSDGALTPANQSGRRLLAWDGVWNPAGQLIWSAYARKVSNSVLELVRLYTITTGAAVVALFGLVAIWNRPRTRELSRFVATYLSLYGAGLVLYQGYFPDFHGLRYLAFPGHLASIAVAAFCVDFAERVFPEPRQRVARRLTVIAAVLLLLASALTSYKDLVQRGGWTEGMRIVPRYQDSEVDAWWRVIESARRDLPPESVIAAKDHGRLAYFTEFRVVDLAGILDPTVTRRLREGRLGAYLHEQGVTHVLLPPRGGSQVERAVRATLDLQPTTGPVSPGAQHSQIYRVDWTGSGAE